MDKTLVMPIIGALAGGLTTWFMVWAKKRTAQVEVEKRQEEAPLVALERVLGQQQAFMGEHLKNDREDRAQVVKALTQITESLRALNDDMVEHRQEERERTASLHERFNGMNEKMGHMDSKLSEVRGIIGRPKNGAE